VPKVSAVGWEAGSVQRVALFAVHITSSIANLPPSLAVSCLISNEKVPEIFGVKVAN
jgi:hypothetical protein